jgi:hypothetical protein
MKRPKFDDGHLSNHAYSVSLDKYIDYLEAELEEAHRNLDAAAASVVGEMTAALKTAETAPPQPDPRDEMIRNLTSELATTQAKLYAIGVLAR